MSSAISESHSSHPQMDVKKALITIDGISYSMLGFGSYPIPDTLCTESIKKAAALGCRIIDTATFYKNFPSIARALEGEERSSFYIISKVWHSMHAPEDVRKDLAETLKQLNTDYLDGYLLHWPNSSIPIEGTLWAMEELRQAHKIHHIGLSKVTVNHLKRALEVGVPITWVQIEMNPHFYDPDLLDFCNEHSIAIQAWGPLQNGRICKDPLLETIGKKYGKTPSQVAIRWILQHGCVPLSNSKNATHIQEGRDVLDFELSVEEMNTIDNQAKQGKRQRYPKEVLGFTDEFEFSYEECWPLSKV